MNERRIGTTEEEVTPSREEIPLAKSACISRPQRHTPTARSPHQDKAWGFLSFYMLC